VWHSEPCAILPGSRCKSSVIRIRHRFLKVLCERFLRNGPISFQVEAPWARPQSGFTLLMEALVVMLARTGMSVAEAARVMGEYSAAALVVFGKAGAKSAGGPASGGCGNVDHR
jgi:hypothetical protein